MKFTGEFQNLRHSLRLKFIIYIIWGIIALSIIYSGYYLFMTRSISTGELEKRGEVTAENFVYNIGSRAISKDKVLLNELIDNIFKDKDVAYVVVTDNNDNVIVSRFREAGLSNQLNAILTTQKIRVMRSDWVHLGNFLR